MGKARSNGFPVMRFGTLCVKPFSHQMYVGVRSVRLFRFSRFLTPNCKPRRAQEEGVLSRLACDISSVKAEKSTPISSGVVSGLVGRVVDPGGWTG